MSERLVFEPWQASASGVTNHASKRWAHAVRQVVVSNHDIRSVREWATAIGASASSIRTWCAIAGERPKPSLDFARLFRAVLLSRRHRCGLWHNYLNVVDARTIERLQHRGRVPLSTSDSQMSPSDFIEHQKFVRLTANIEELMRIFREQPEGLPYDRGVRSALLRQ